MDTIAHPSLDGSTARVQVAAAGGSRSVVAAVDLPAGAAILTIDGPVQPFPSRHSVQVGISEHVEGRPGHDGERAVWCFLNHSCRPNAILHARVLVAVRDIRAGEHVTFDYDTNEWDMSDPFMCRCGASSCRGMIRGYSHLAREHRERLSPLLSPHIIALARWPAVN